MSGNGHPTREEDFDLLVLGALEGDERQAIESHVAECADCARKFAEARQRIALLALAAPPVKPSPDVKTRLMRRIREDAARTAKGPARVASEEKSTGGWGRWWNAVLVPVAAMLLFATAYLWREVQVFDQQLAILRATVVEQQDQLDEDRQVADLIAAPDTMVVTLAPQPGLPQGIARVVYNPRSGTLVYNGQLEKAPDAKSYQLWLVPATGDPISAGVFNPTTSKTSHWVIKLPPGTMPKAFAVTLEPAGGAPRPTGPKVLVGAAS